MKKALSLIVLFAIIIMFTTTFLKYSHKNISHDNPPKISDAVMLSKKEVDDLVKKVAQQKYLQDVFNDDKTLPMTKSKNVPLQPYQNNAAVNTKNNEVMTQNPSLTRCSYNGQNYSAGDIVKVDQIWLRCTPIFYFSTDKPIVKQSAQPAWTAVQ